jgi:hypothetical protein
VPLSADVVAIPTELRTAQLRTKKKYGNADTPWVAAVRETIALERIRAASGAKIVTSMIFTPEFAPDPIARGGSWRRAVAGVSLLSTRSQNDSGTTVPTSSMSARAIEGWRCTDCLAVLRQLWITQQPAFVHRCANPACHRYVFRLKRDQNNRLASTVDQLLQVVAVLGGRVGVKVNVGTDGLLELRLIRADRKRRRSSCGSTT